MIVQFWKPEIAIQGSNKYMAPPLYGLTNYSDLFTPLQLLILDTFTYEIKTLKRKLFVMVVKLNMQMQLLHISIVLGGRANLLVFICCVERFL